MSDIQGTERDVNWGNGTSVRLLVEKHRMGFGLNYTTVNKGTETKLQYKNHLEACFCLKGEGEIEDMEGNVWKIKPNDFYALP